MGTKTAPEEVGGTPDRSLPLPKGGGHIDPLISLCPFNIDDISRGPTVAISFWNHV